MIKKDAVKRENVWRKSRDEFMKCSERQRKREEPKGKKEIDERTRVEQSFVFILSFAREAANVLRTEREK